jgi:hypothetical protein
MSEQSPGAATPSARELIQTLTHQIVRLLADEFALARSELRGKVRGMLVAAVCGAAAGAAGFLGAGALVLTAIGLLRLVMPLWAAALVVAGMLLIGAALLALAAKSLVAGILPLVPERTIASLKEDLAWLTTTTQNSSKNG